MKRVDSSDSLAPICTSGWLEDNDEDMVDSSGHTKSIEKKRRLGTEQVKALENNFEVENKLEPERKARLAEELGLQPRQVAVWFQNRRARWKTKQLEHDYGVLKSNYDALQVEYEKMARDKESLLYEVRDLKAKLNFEDESVSSIIKDEPAEELLIYKDGSSDSDSSAVLNDKENHTHLSFKTNANITKNSSFSSSFVFKIEEDDFLGGEEPCSSNFFHDEQAPTLSWYCGGGWE